MREQFLRIYYFKISLTVAVGYLSRFSFNSVVPLDSVGKEIKPLASGHNFGRSDRMFFCPIIQTSLPKFATTFSCDRLIDFFS